MYFSTYDGTKVSEHNRVIAPSSLYHQCVIDTRHNRCTRKAHSVEALLGQHKRWMRMQETRLGSKERCEGAQNMNMNVNVNRNIRAHVPTHVHARIHVMSTFASLLTS